MSQDIYQIIYLSKTEEDLSDDVLEKILTQAQKNNSAQGLTGILLYKTKNSFRFLKGGMMRSKRHFRVSQTTHATTTWFCYMMDV